MLCGWVGGVMRQRAQIMSFDYMVLFLKLYDVLTYNQRWHLTAELFKANFVLKMLNGFYNEFIFAITGRIE